jgi:hypothetical protein
LEKDFGDVVGVASIEREVIAQVVREELRAIFAPPNVAEEVKPGRRRNGRPLPAAS